GRGRAGGGRRDVDVDPRNARDLGGPQAVRRAARPHAQRRGGGQGDRTSSDDFHADLLVAGKDPPARTKGVLSQGCRPAGLFEGGTECSVLTGKSEDLPVSVSPASAFGDRKSTRLNSSHLVISYAV